MKTGLFDVIAQPLKTCDIRVSRSLSAEFLGTFAIAELLHHTAHVNLDGPNATSRFSSL